MCPDFVNNDGGIYRHVSGSSVGGHAVNYWRIANSWNPEGEITVTSALASARAELMTWWWRLLLTQLVQS